MNKTVVLYTSENSARAAALSRILEEKYDVVRVKTVPEAADCLESRFEDVKAVILDVPSETEGAQELIDWVRKTNTYLFAVPILALTDAQHRARDEEFLDDTVLATIEEGQSPRVIFQRVEKTSDSINSISFQAFSEMLRALPSMIYLKDEKARYVFCSQLWHHVSGYGKEGWTIRGKTDMDVRKDSENAHAAYERDLNIIATGKGTNYIIEENDDGVQEFLQIIKEPIRGPDGRVSGIIAIINDVTEQETLRRELRRRSITDELTGLYNRMYFDEYTDGLKPEDFPIGVISADCDGLKLINDRFGHAVGDEYIRMTATLLRSVLLEEGSKFRMGGDEFMVLLPHVSEDGLKARLNELQRMEKVFSLRESKLSVSFGVAVARTREELSAALLRSDEEMYEVKRTKKAIRGVESEGRNLQE